jgi:capsular polysaccharide biosynthesis protein
VRHQREQVSLNIVLVIMAIRMTVIMTVTVIVTVVMIVIMRVVMQPLRAGRARILAEHQRLDGDRHRI